MSAQAAIAPAKVVISQVYGGGGNSGATYNRDFVELFNSGGETQSLSGWSIQYTSSGATGSWSVTALGALSLQPGQYLLVGLGSGTSGGAALPAVDVSGTTAMSASSGHIAVVASTTALAKGCPVSGTAIDLIGYGKSAACTEGGTQMTSDLSATKAALRGGWGCTDTNNNATDFSVTGPAPRNSATPTDVCASSGLPTNIKASGSASPISVLPGESVLLTVAVTPGANPTSSGLTVSADLSSIAGSASQSLYDNGSNGDAVAGDNVFSLRNTVPSTATIGSKTLPISIRDNDGRSAGTSIAMNVVAVLDAINKIQGTGRESPYTIGSTAVAEGIVTAVTYSGFFLQTPDGQTDGNAASSEGIYVYSRNPVPSAAVVGNRVRVTGTISEYTDSDNPNQMSVTELTTPYVNLISSGQALPAPIVITDTDANAASAIDHLERYEGMRISIPALKAVGPVIGTTDEPNATATSDGIFIGALPTVARPFRELGIGALDVMLDNLPVGVNPPIFDTNPERIRVDSRGQTGAATLSVDVGDTVSGLVGVLDYASNTYTLLPDPSSAAMISPGATIKAATAATASEITIGGFNLYRFFDTLDDSSTTDPVLTTTAFNNRLMKTSNAICAFTRNPDILGVVEVENIGALTALANTINEPTKNTLFPNSCTENPNYAAYLVEGNDIGGIDIGFLVKTAEVTTGVPRVEVLSITQVGKDATYDNPNGTVSTLNDRPPLVLEARVHHANGATADVTVIANHLRSFGGINSTEPGSSGWATEGERVRAKRAEQARFLAELIKQYQDADPNKNLVVIGDFNAYEFNDGYVDSMGIVAGREASADAVIEYVDSPITEPLTNMNSLSSAADRYSYSYDGNAQTIDHILVNDAILESMAARIEHPRINADFGADNYGDYSVPVRVSDHDPVVLYLGEPSFSTADLSVTAKANATSVEAGKPAVFTVTAGNAGTGSASGAKLDLSIAVLPSTVSVTPANGWTCGAPIADGSAAALVHCNRDSMASGVTGNFTVSLTTTTGQAGQTLSLGAAISSGATDPVSGNNSASAQVSLTAPVVTVDLSAKVTAPTTLLFKQKGGTYTVEAQNLSANTAKNGVLALELTAASSVAQSLTPPSGWTCTLLSSASPAKWSCKTASGDIAGSSKASFSMFVKPTSSPATYKLTATVTTSSNDTNSANNSASASKTVN